MAVYFIVFLGVAGLRLLFRLIAWCLRHPVTVGVVAISLVAASHGTVWLIAWGLLCAAVVGAAGVERGPHAGVITGAVLMVARAVWFAVRHPLIALLVALTAAAVVLGGPTGPALLAGWLVAVAGVWQWLWPMSWEKVATCTWRPAWRNVTRYWWAWPDTMQAAGLTERLDGDDTRLIPRKVRIRSTRWVDQVHAELLPAQHTGQWEDAAPKLAASFGADDCRVRRTNPRSHTVELAFRRGDPLEQVLDPFSPVPIDQLDLSAVPLGMTELGERWTLPLLEAHWLVVGSMRSGKGSVTGSAVNALALAVHAGLVELYGCDPKGGIEMSMYADLFTHLAWDPADMIDLCEFTQNEMTTRNDNLRGKARHYTLSTETPHKVLIVDEFAFLTAYLGNKRLRERFESAIGAILSQGGGPGYSVIGLVQDPRKDVIPMRDLFPIKTGLRIDGGPDIIDAALGDGSYAKGAYCDQIPMTSRGVAYVRQDGFGEIERVRATWTDDPYLRNLAARYPAPKRPAQIIDVTETTTGARSNGAGQWDDADHDDTAVWDVA